MLEDTTDCKWIYERLVEIWLDFVELGGGRVGSGEERKEEEEEKKKEGLEAKWEEARGWREKLAGLDPLRSGRWEDLRTKLEDVKMRCVEQRLGKDMVWRARPVELS